MASQNSTAIFGICKLEASTPVAFGFNVSLKHSQLTLKLRAVGLIVSAVVTVRLAVDFSQKSTAKATPRFSLTSTEESHLFRLKTYGYINAGSLLKYTRRAHSLNKLSSE